MRAPPARPTGWAATWGVFPQLRGITHHPGAAAIALTGRGDCVSGNPFTTNRLAAGAYPEDFCDGTNFSPFNLDAARDLDIWPGDGGCPMKAKGRVIVIGAGAGGMMAAGRAAERGAEVLLLEKTDGPGKKILISGRSRCNLSNTRDLKSFIAMFGPSGRFLYGCFHLFFREELLEFLARRSVETKTERGGRIFPAADDAAEVVAALLSYLREGKVELRLGEKVQAVELDAGRVSGVRTEKGLHRTAAVVLAAGGSSWPGTGSTGDGYRIAKSLGHRIVPLRPALIPLVVEEAELARAMQGVSLKNVRLTVYSGRSDRIDPSLAPPKDCGARIAGSRPHPPVIESRLGEMLFTHFGLGGPIVLLMSLAVVDALAKGEVSCTIDLKPALSREQLEKRLQRDLDAHGKRSLRAILKGLLPEKMIDPILTHCRLDPDKPAHQVSAAERGRLAGLLKALPFNVKGTLPMTSAIVTAGGVELSEIDPKTMASRLVPGLFFCGEVMDLDADTGGYNLQAAFSTGYVAGEGAAAFVQEPLSD
ncbi:MAG: NAD(P)/FAD-dependent oxidoreductase [Smithellaceae bacterium]|nr:NAD(P)/FAD-dependent oxidoreductase [Smithellaceae bacterium]